ncbi:hypothetical protein PanWU01x14_057600, partial [Parasponia andersonii]
RYNRHLEISEPSWSPSYLDWHLKYGEISYSIEHLNG